MNNLMVLQEGITMTTVEIAALTGKQHNNVMRDTKAMLVELYGENSLLSFEQSYSAANGQIYPCYNLQKKEVLVLVSGYSIKLRMKIVTRLEELENHKTLDFDSPDTVLMLAQNWKDEKDKRERLEKQNQRMLPKVQAFDTFLETDGLYILSDAMKALGYPPYKTLKRLRDMGILFMRDGRNIPYEIYRVKGYFKVMMKTNHLQQKSYPQTFVTESGLAFLDSQLSEPVLLAMA